MAPFNPELQPTQDPNYLRYAKVVEPSPVIPNTGGAQAATAIGQAASSVLQTVDTFMQQKATEEARVGAEGIQDSFTQLLKGQAPSDIIPAPVQTGQGATVSQPSLMDANDQMTTPSGVQDGLNRINALNNARSGGKINDTYYTAQLTALAKNLRNKYPGYRDYVDAEISKVTGLNPAKAYINNLMQDINAQRSEGQKFTDKVTSELLSMNSKGVSGANDALVHFLQTGDAAGALKWMNTVQSDSYKATAAEQALSLEAATDKATGDKMEKAFTVKGNSMVDAAWSAASMRAGVDTPSAIQKMVQDKALGVGGPIDSSRMQAAALNLQAQRDDMEQRLRAQGRAPLRVKMSDGSIKTTTYEAELGPARYEAKISSLLKPYDTTINGITNEKTGTATFSATVGQRTRADYDAGVVTDPANKQLLGIEWLNKNAGPQWGNMVTTQALKADVDGIYAGLLRNKTINAATGARPGLPAPSFKQDIEDAVQGKNTTNGEPIDPNSRYFDALLDNVNLLATPTTDAGSIQGKKAIAKYFFDPRNIGTLSNLKLDTWDEHGNKIPGRESVFRVLSSPEISRSIKELGKSDPFIEKNYKDYIEYEWGQKIFQPQLMQMRDFLDGTASRQVSDPRGLHIAFDRDSNQLQMIDNKGRPITQNIGRTPVEQNYYNFQKRNLDNLNGGLRNLTEMHKELGGDTGEYLIRTMENAGINVGSNKIGQAIINSSDVAKKRFEEIFKEKMRAQEPKVEGNEPTLGAKGGINQ